MKHLTSLFLLSALTILPLTVSAQPSPPEREFPRWEERRGRLLEELNLTPQQKQQLEVIRQQRQGELADLQQRKQQLRQEMDQLLSSNAPEQQLRAKFQEVQAVKSKMAEIRFEQMLAMRQILTPEQRTKFRELMSQRPPMRPRRSF
ncbi:MAG: Spy/CpxP family protein refolding chaperone [Pseudanabaenaceae cyanobacterium SKYGB_i_bin29]|nr:Spy/CpxP family protein refolding chaperone [Pseudanabaenaceae cyanobacterium SKYG29]MDW8421547.1 Spy/CpxP family protein refolding chaperone [Pseudanabaenaceae cyanobacterium SKYGB_i_bin29]